jgi:hypothetical protein
VSIGVLQMPDLSKLLDSLEDMARAIRPSGDVTIHFVVAPTSVRVEIRVAGVLYHKQERELPRG